MSTLADWEREHVKSYETRIGEPLVPVRTVERVIGERPCEGFRGEDRDWAGPLDHPYELVRVPASWWQFAKLWLQRHWPRRFRALRVRWTEQVHYLEGER